MAITQTIDAITTTPDIADPTNFEADANQLLNVELPNLQTQLNTWAGQVNALVAGLNAIAAGSAMAISYTFSTTTTDSDPGAGTLRLNNATQNTATVVRADLLDAAGTDWSSALGTIGDSTSTVKGYLQISKLNDASKMLLFTVSALASPSGYKNITVTCIAFSTASPFANGDTVVMEFTRTGDKGTTGDAGVVDAATLASTIHGATGKTTPINADELVLVDSADSNALKRLTWQNLLATAKTYFDTLYSGVLPASVISLNTGNGWGSTSTKIRRYSVVATNTGSDMTLANSSTLGTTITINTTGIYTISAFEKAIATSVADGGISVNSAQLTTAIDSITAANQLGFGIGDSTGTHNTCCSWTGLLTATDVIRPHGEGSSTNTSANVRFIIRRLA